jgi:hypothetical protein
MRYDNIKATAPAMPSLQKARNTANFSSHRHQKSIQDPLVPMLFPVLGVHISGIEFQYPDLIWKETTEQSDNFPSISLQIHPCKPADRTE